MSSASTEEIEYPYWKEFLLLPYRLTVGWWLDTLLRKPSDTVFRRAFEKEFSWFMKKHDLRSIQNPMLYNLLGVYLNAKLLTMQSPDLRIRFHYLVNEFNVEVRPRSSTTKWVNLPAIFPDLLAKQEMNWISMVEFLDQNWNSLVAAMKTAEASR